MCFCRMLILLIAVFAIAGCKAMPWYAPSAPHVEPTVVENFSETRPKPAVDVVDLDDSTEAAAKANDRSQLNGSGLSDRSRKIEQRLGYE